MHLPPPAFTHPKDWLARHPSTDTPCNFWTSLILCVCVFVCLPDSLKKKTGRLGQQLQEEYVGFRKTFPPSCLFLRAIKEKRDSFSFSFFFLISCVVLLKPLRWSLVWQQQTAWWTEEAHRYLSVTWTVMREVTGRIKDSEASLIGI